MTALGADATEARVLALARRFGWNATSSQVLEPGYKYFFLDEDACVAYVDTGGAWVAAGAPLADDERITAAAVAFVAAAHMAGRRACFFGTEERCTRRLPFQHLLSGEQAIWDPLEWTDTLRGNRNLREQLRRARAKGVSARAVPLAQAIANRASMESAIRDLVKRWHLAREMAPMGFVARVEPLPALPDQVLFLAEQEDRLVGLLSVAPIYARDGWLLQSLLRAPDAPNGTAEALIDRAMREAAARGRTLVTLGLAPLAGDVALPLRFVRAAGAGLYNFEGLRAFKAKLRPTRWDRIFVSFPAETGSVHALVDVLAAFARGGLLRFCLRTLLRGPAVVLSLLAMLLVPWTVLLSIADSELWFPHPAVKWAWVGFDILLAAGLFTLRARWLDGLARMIVLATGVDAVLTTVEGVCWNLPRVTGASGGVALAVASTAPALAFLVVSRTVARRSAPREHAVARPR